MDERERLIQAVERDARLGGLSMWRTKDGGWQVSVMRESGAFSVFIADTLDEACGEALKSVDGKTPRRRMI